MGGLNDNPADFASVKNRGTSLTAGLVGPRAGLGVLEKRQKYLVPSGIRTTDVQPVAYDYHKRILFVNYGRQRQLAWAWRRWKALIKQPWRKLCGNVWSGFIWYKKEFSGRSFWTLVKYTERNNPVIWITFFLVGSAVVLGWQPYHHNVLTV
jgi:hypothetical protein